MIQCLIPNSDPVKDYNDYGCYCGLEGSGTPLDELDKCCQVHDHCYKQTKTHPHCGHIFGNRSMVTYSHTCTGTSITCSSKNEDCAGLICECDHTAAMCFSYAGYNPAYKTVDKNVYCQ